MGQKVQIVATLIHDPELIVLDEPFSGLDPVNVELVRNIVLAQRARNRTVLLSTHVMEQAEQICDGLILINHGRKLLDGTLSDIRRSAAAHRLSIDYDGDGACLEESARRRARQRRRAPRRTEPAERRRSRKRFSRAW